MKLDAWLKQDRSLEERLLVIERLCQSVNEIHDRGDVLEALDPGRIEVGAEGQCDLSGAAKGSPRPPYAPPEGGHGASAPADVYAAGAISWEMLAGRPVARPPSHLAEVRPDLSRELADAVMACLEQSPDWRPNDLTYLAQMAAARQRASESRTAPASRKARTSRAVPKQAPRRGPSRRTWPLLAALVVVLGLAAVAARQYLGGMAVPFSTADPAPTTAPPTTPTPASTPSPPATPSAGAGGDDTTVPPDAQEANTPSPPTPPPASPVTEDEAPVEPAVAFPVEEAPAPASPPTLPSPSRESDRALPTPNTTRTPTVVEPVTAPEETAPEPASPAPDAEPPAPVEALEPAVLSAVSPLSVKRPGKVLVDLRGTGLRPEHRAQVLAVRRVPRGIAVAGQKYVSDTLITVLLQLDETAEPGEYALAVEDGRGGRSEPLTFTVTK